MWKKWFTVLCSDCFRSTLFIKRWHSAFFDILFFCYLGQTNRPNFARDDFCTMYEDASKRIALNFLYTKCFCQKFEFAIYFHTLFLTCSVDILFIFSTARKKESLVILSQSFEPTYDLTQILWGVPVCSTSVWWVPPNKK